MQCVPRKIRLLSFSESIGTPRFYAKASSIQDGFLPDFARTNLLSSRSAIRLVDSVLLRSLSSQVTREFVIRYDPSVRRCLSVLLEVDVLMDTWEVVNLSLSYSILVTFGMIPRRRPDVANFMRRALRVRSPGSHVEGTVADHRIPVDTGFRKSAPWDSDRTSCSTTTIPRFPSAGDST